MRFPYRCGLDFGGIALSGTPHGANKLRSALFRYSYFGFDIVDCVDNHIVWAKIEIFYPVIIDFGINFFNTGVEALQNLHFHFPHMFATDLAVLVGNVVTIVIDDGDIVDTCAIEAIEGKTPHATDSKYQDFRFA